VKFADLHGTDSFPCVVTYGDTKRYNPKKGIFFQYQFLSVSPFLRNFKATPIFYGCLDFWRSFDDNESDENRMATFYSPSSFMNSFREIGSFIN